MRFMKEMLVSFSSSILKVLEETKEDWNFVDKLKESIFLI